MAKDPKSMQKILDVAQDMISKNGVAKSSLRLISKEADISTGTLYYHYQSKNLLLADLLKKRFGGPQKLSIAILEHKNSDEDPIDTLIELLIRRTKNIKSSCVYLHMLDEAYSSNPEIFEIVKTQNMDWLNSLEIIISNLCGIGIGPETYTKALALESISQGLMFQYMLHENESNIDYTIESIAGTIRELLESWRNA